MSINWKLRLQNKATLTTLCMSVVTAIYCVLAAFGITPSVAEEQTMNLVYAVISIACSVGIVVDPTTSGMGDSEQAMAYESPKQD